MRTTLFILFFISCLFSAVPAHSTQEIPLTIKECIVLTLKKNLEISIEKFNPIIADTEIIEQKSEFDPRLAFSSTASNKREPSASAFADPSVGETEAYDINAGITSKFVTGTEISLNAKSGRIYSNSRFQGLNPQYDTSLNLNVTQPLLKNFGKDVNKSKIIISMKNKKGSLLQLKNKVINTISLVQETYWNLVLAIENFTVKKETLDLARKFEERVRIQVKIGVLAPIEITQAMAEAAAREEEVIVAENSIRNKEDLLKKFMNIDFDSWNNSIIPVDSPSVDTRKGNLEEDIGIALENRPDYLFIKNSLDINKVNIQYKKNQLYPALDFVGNLQLNGISGDASSTTALDGTSSQSAFGGDYWKSIETTGSGKYYNWQIGMTLNMPIGNRKAKSRYLTAKLERKKTEQMVKNLKQQIVIQVRDAVRKIETALKRIHTTSAASTLSKERLKAEETKFQLGMSTVFNILEAQRDLSGARSKELLAVADYNKSLDWLERVKGTLLEKNGISLDEI